MTIIGDPQSFKRIVLAKRSPEYTERDKDDTKGKRPADNKLYS